MWPPTRLPLLHRRRCRRRLDIVPCTVVGPGTATAVVAQIQVHVPVQVHVRTCVRVRFRFRAYGSQRDPIETG